MLLKMLRKQPLPKLKGRMSHVCGDQERRYQKELLEYCKRSVHGKCATDEREQCPNGTQMILEQIDAAKNQWVVSEIERVDVLVATGGN